MQRQIFLCSFIVVFLSFVSACGDGGSSSGGGVPATTPVAISPGGTIPLGTTVRITASGTYSLPKGANTITTRCTGEVTVTIPGAGQSNTCNSPDGSANQTNSVAGESEVMYELGQAASAQVTVN